MLWSSLWLWPLKLKAILSSMQAAFLPFVPRAGSKPCCSDNATGSRGTPRPCHTLITRASGQARYRVATRVTAKTGGAMSRRPTIPTACCAWGMNWGLTRWSIRPWRASSIRWPMPLMMVCWATVRWWATHGLCRCSSAYCRPNMSTTATRASPKLWSVTT